MPCCFGSLAIKASKIRAISASVKFLVFSARFDSLPIQAFNTAMRSPQIKTTALSLTLVNEYLAE